MRKLNHIRLSGWTFDRVAFKYDKPDGIRKSTSIRARHHEVKPANFCENTNSLPC